MAILVIGVVFVSGCTQIAPSDIEMTYISYGVETGVHPSSTTWVVSEGVLTIEEIRGEEITTKTITLSQDQLNELAAAIRWANPLYLENEYEDPTIADCGVDSYSFVFEDTIKSITVKCGAPPALSDISRLLSWFRSGSR